VTSTTISNFNYTPGSSLFNRTYSLAIGAPKQTQAIQFSNLDQTIQSPPVPSAAFRITFDIEKNLFGSSPNHAKIEIYNMQAQNRSKIRAGYVMQLRAGYRGLMDTIFMGNISMLGGIKNERKGPDIVTSFECGEGEAALVMGRLDKSYPAGTALQAILNDIVSAMELNGVVTDSSVSGSIYSSTIPTITYGRGFTAHGPCKDILTKLLKNSGYRWTVQDGNLYIVKIGTIINPAKAIVVASGVTVDPSSGVSRFDPGKATGLIGVPSVGQNFVSFSCLLNPNIKPGAYVQLICEDVTLNGFYKVNKAHYQGDTHDNKWHIACETTLQAPQTKGVTGA
jgi:hypothetical protein